MPHFSLECRLPIQGVGGANGGASSMRVRAGVLEWLRLGTAQFDKVSCLLATVPAVSGLRLCCHCSADAVA